MGVDCRLRFPEQPLLAEGALPPPGLIEQMRAEQQTPPGAKLAVGVAQEFVQSKPTSSHHHASLLKSRPT